MNGKPDFILSDMERLYLLKGKTGSYSEKELRRRISKRADMMDVRLQNLMDDLVLMQEHDLLNQNNNADSFCEIFNLKNRIDHTLSMSISKRKVGTHPKEEALPVEKCRTNEEVGYLIGGLLHLLMTMAPEERPWDELLMGILMFYVMNPNKKSANQIEKLERIVEYDIKRPENVNRTISDIKKEHNYEFDHDNDETIHDRISRALRNHNISDSVQLNAYIMTEIDYIDVLRDVEEAVQEIIDELKSETIFDKVLNVCKIIQQDKAYISKAWRGPSRKDIIIKKIDPDDPDHPKEIASQLTNELHDNLVTTALNKMSSKVDQGEMWTTYPLFVNTEDGLEPTPYGLLFARYLNRDISFNALHLFAISDRVAAENIESNEELISDVLDQFYT